MADQQLQDAYEKAKKQSDDFGFIWAALLKSNTLNCTNVWQVFEPQLNARARAWSTEKIIPKVAYLTLLPDWPTDVVGSTKFINYCNESRLNQYDLQLIAQQLNFSKPNKEEILECISLTTDSTRYHKLEEYFIQLIKTGFGNKKIDAHTLNTLVTKKHPSLASNKIWEHIKKDSITPELFNDIHEDVEANYTQAWALKYAILNSPLAFIHYWEHKDPNKKMDDYIATSITGNAHYISSLGKKVQYAVCNMLPSNKALELSQKLKLDVSDPRFETRRPNWEWTLPVLHSFIKQAKVLDPEFVIKISHQIFDSWRAQTNENLQYTKLAFIDQECTNVLMTTPASKDNAHLLKKEIVAYLLVSGIPELRTDHKEKLKKALGHDIRTPTGEAQVIKKLYPELKGVLHLIKSIGLNEIDAWNYYSQQRLAPFKVETPPLDTSALSTLSHDLI